MPVEAFPPAKRMQSQVSALASAMHAQRWETLPALARERVLVILFDLLTVARAGARTPELASVLGATDLPPGEVAVIGTDVRTTPDQAAFWTAAAACVLELDEGNKVAAGHPAAHVAPAVVAAALLSSRPVTGRQVLTAVAVGYEVAARFGHATRLDPSWHPHGHWGCTGAAAGVAHLLGASAQQIAAAIDAATGLMRVAPWPTVLAGGYTRNLWMAGGVDAGLHAARLALAGVVENTGASAAALAMVGEVEPSRLTARLGGRWLLTEGYLKQHAACSFTHAAVDLVLALRLGPTWGASDVIGVEVRTTSLARPLLTRHPRTRLAAMFSLPFVVGCALSEGVVDPSTTEPGSPAFVRAEETSELVRVEIDPRLDAYLPGRRCTEVVLRLREGGTVSLGAPDPVGDAAHFPLDADARRRKAELLVGTAEAARTAAAVGTLVEPGRDARPALLSLLE